MQLQLQHPWNLSEQEAIALQEEPTLSIYSGLFSFRELPPIIKAFEQVKTIPQLVVCHGQGIAHPKCWPTHRRIKQNTLLAALFL